MLADDILQPMVLILLTGNSQRGFQLSRNLHVVVTIDAEDILNDIARTLHVHTISRYCEFESFLVLMVNAHLQALDNALDGVVA